MLTSPPATADPVIAGTDPADPATGTATGTATDPVAGTAPRARGFARWAAEPHASAVPLMRSRVRAVLDDWQVAADVADVLLLAVSELVGNVVLHAAAATGGVRVGISRRGPWLHLDVADGAAALPRLPHPRTQPGPEAEHGRGLLLVQLLAAEIGGLLTVVAHGSGKSVRVRVPAA